MPQLNCAHCNIEFHLKPFHLKRFKGPFCYSRKCRGSFLKTQYLGNNNPNKKYADNIESFFAERFYCIRKRSTKHNIPFNLDIDYMVALYKEQKGLCYYSNIPMKMGSVNFNSRNQADIDTLSVDKIDPIRGYIKGNIVYCCSGINKLKGNSNIEETLYFIEQLCNHYKKDLCPKNEKKIVKNGTKVE